jgi:pimeloyl-ACP methyl ester carboxylesterase
MVNGVSRRGFLIGASAVALAACTTSPPRDRLLGHRIVGNGPQTVVVLHEWLGDHSNYDGVLPYLSQQRARYVFADLRGYGLSGELSGSYTAAEAAGDVLALMDSLGAQRFSVVGHSMSGLIAQYLAVEHPERVERIVAISPVPATGFKTDAAGIAKLATAITDDEALRKAVIARTGNRYGQPWLDRKLAVARRARPDAMHGYLAMFTGTDFAARMTGLPMPATLIAGNQDIPYYSLAALEPAFRRAFPTLQATAIADAGHYSMVETPVLLAALMERGLFA